MNRPPFFVPQWWLQFQYGFLVLILPAFGSFLCFNANTIRLGMIWQWACDSILRVSPQFRKLYGQIPSRLRRANIKRVLNHSVQDCDFRGARRRFQT